MKFFVIFFLIFLGNTTFAQSLREKEKIFNDRANASKSQFGLIGTSSDIPIWTGVYVASQAYRYKVTGDPIALKQLEESLWGLVKLHNITQIPGLIAKGIVPISKDEAGNLPGEFFAGKDEFSDYMWKGKISFDQYVGYIYGLTEGFFAAEDLELKMAVSKVLSDIANHFIDHGEKIIGPLTSLNFDPAISTIISVSPGSGFLATILYSRGGKAMYALQLLKSAYVVSGDLRFKNYYDHLIKDKKYDIIVRDNTQAKTERLIAKSIGAINLFTKLFVGTAIKATTDSLRSDVGQNLGHISLAHLTSLESDPQIRSNFLEGLRGAHQPVSRHGNTYWNFLFTDVSNEDQLGIREGVDSLSRFPMDDYGKRANSGDPSIEKYKGLNANFFKGDKWSWYAKKPIPFEKRPMHSFAWQQNALALDSSFGSGDAPGVAYLIAYWLGRKDHFVDEGW